MYVHLKNAKYIKYIWTLHLSVTSMHLAPNNLLSYFRINLCSVSYKIYHNILQTLNNVRINSWFCKSTELLSRRKWFWKQFAFIYVGSFHHQPRCLNYTLSCDCSQDDHRITNICIYGFKDAFMYAHICTYQNIAIYTRQKVRTWYK